MAIMAIKMANNKLDSLDGIGAASQGLGIVCNDVTWLDVSFNKIAKISDAIHCFPNLESLTLTNNCIESLKDLRVLRPLKKLHTIHLLGNPICNSTAFGGSVKKYRKALINMFPHLAKLDSAMVTKKERELAQYKF